MSSWGNEARGLGRRKEKMTRVHKKFENGFAWLAAKVYDHKSLALILMLLMTVAFAIHLPELTIDTRDESFFHPDDPALITYNNFRDTFGQDDQFIIAMQPRRGITLEFMHTLHAMHQELEGSVPYIDDITSLVNGRVVTAQKDTLNVGDLMPSPPVTDQELRDLLQQIDRYPLYDRLLVSDNRDLACIVIKAQATKEVSAEEALAGFDDIAGPANKPAHRYLSNAESVEISTAIRKVLARYQSPDIGIYFAGTPAVVAELQKSIEKDITRMVPLSYLLIIVFLTVLFRRISGVIYPLVIVFFSFAATFGVMAMVSLPLTNVNQILPTFLVVVGIGDSVHILTIFYRLYRQTDDKRHAIIQAMGYAGLPVLMTSVTTACGLLSFAWADVATVAQLGYIAPVGVMLALLYTVILLPALIGIFPVRGGKSAMVNGLPMADRIFDWVARVTTGRPLMVVAISGLLVAITLVGALSVRFSHNAVTWFPKDSPIRMSTELLDRVNGGTVTLEILVDSGHEDGLYNPDLQHRLEQAAHYLPTLNVNDIQAGKAWSIADLVKEINRALHEDQATAYKVPESRSLIAQEIMLFAASGSDDLDDMTDSMYRTARLSVLIPFKDAVLYKDYVDRIQKYLRKQFPQETVTVTGHNALFIRIIKNLITSLAKSYIFALLIITLLMVLMVGRVRIGLLSMTANVAPIVGVLGLMGFSNIPVDMGTILIGSVILGLVVDDTIHFLHHFRRAFEETGSVETAVRETLHNTGRALVITSLVLCGGFFIYTSAYLAVNARFGLLAGFAVIFALAADFFMVPALLTLAYGKKPVSP